MRFRFGIGIALLLMLSVFALAATDTTTGSKTATVAAPSSKTATTSTSTAAVTSSSLPTLYNLNKYPFDFSPPEDCSGRQVPETAIQCLIKDKSLQAAGGFNIDVKVGTAYLQTLSKKATTLYTFDSYGETHAAKYEFDVSGDKMGAIFFDGKTLHVYAGENQIDAAVAMVAALFDEGIIVSYELGCYITASKDAKALAFSRCYVESAKPADFGVQSGNVEGISTPASSRDPAVQKILDGLSVKGSFDVKKLPDDFYDNYFTYEAGSDPRSDAEPVRPGETPEKGPTIASELQQDENAKQAAANSPKTAVTEACPVGFTPPRSDTFYTSKSYHKKVIWTGGQGYRYPLYKGGKHAGIDFIIPTGTQLKAFEDGVVEQIFANPNNACGLEVLVRTRGNSPDALDWKGFGYCHMSKITAKEGKKVAKGDVLGLSGNTGKSDEPHVHIFIAELASDKGKRYYKLLPEVDSLCKAQVTNAETKKAAATLPTTTSKYCIVDEATFKSSAPTRTDFKQYDNNLKTICDGYLPKISATLSKAIPSQIRFEFDAATGRSAGAIAPQKRIVLSLNHFSEPRADDGAVVHELAHLFQDYPTGAPSWATEGIADYIRLSLRPEDSSRINRAGCVIGTDYTSVSYGCIADFLVKAQKASKACPNNLVAKLNACFRAGGCDFNAIFQQCGLTSTEIAWQQYGPGTTRTTAKPQTTLEFASEDTGAEGATDASATDHETPLDDGSGTADATITSVGFPASSEKVTTNVKKGDSGILAISAVGSDGSCTFNPATVFRKGETAPIGSSICVWFSLGEKETEEFQDVAFAGVSGWTGRYFTVRGAIPKDSDTKYPDDYEKVVFIGSSLEKAGAKGGKFQGYYLAKLPTYKPGNDPVEGVFLRMYTGVDPEKFKNEVEFNAIEKPTSQPGIGRDRVGELEVGVIQAYERKAETTAPAPRTSSGNGEKSSSTGYDVTGELALPVVTSKWRTGPYAGDTGCDLHVPQGTDAIAVADGCLIYSEYGHVAKAWTIPPATPYSIMLKVDKPIVYNGRTYQYFAYRHMQSDLTYTVKATKWNTCPEPAVRVKKGDKLGTVGQANHVAHLHFEVLTDRYGSDCISSGICLPSAQACQFVKSKMTAANAGAKRTGTASTPTYTGAVDCSKLSYVVQRGGKYSPSVSTERMQTINAAIAKYSTLDYGNGLPAIPWQFVCEIAAMESKFNANTGASSKGARGIIQVMPGTATELQAKYNKGDYKCGCSSNPSGVEEGICCGIAYLKQGFKATGNLAATAAYYNGGPVRATLYTKSGTKNLPYETKDYVNGVTSFLDQQSIALNVQSGTRAG